MLLSMLFVCRGPALAFLALALAGTRDTSHASSIFSDNTLLLHFLLLNTGAELVRINLSEQTDMMDLLGADLPVAGGAPGEFAW